MLCNKRFCKQNSLIQLGLAFSKLSNKFSPNLKNLPKQVTSLNLQIFLELTVICTPPVCQFGQIYIPKTVKDSKKGNQHIIKDSSISTIVDAITAPTEMAESFNNFLTSIEKNLQKNIPPTKKTFIDYLKTPNLENFTICLTSADEISDLICSFDSSKSISPCSIPAKILKNSQRNSLTTLVSTN